MMYSETDFDTIKAKLKRYWVICIAILVVAAGSYAAMTILHQQWFMLAALLLGFIVLSFGWALWILPAKRYLKFLTMMREGLTHETLCTLESVDDQIQMQDGARVRSVQIRLADKENETRLFYINVSKQEQLPAMGTKVRLTSSGRHICDVKAA